MENIVTISLAENFTFQIEESAAESLQEYLSSLQERLGATPEGKEVFCSLEERIVELFSELAPDKTPITTAIVQRVISILGSPEQICEDENTSTQKKPKAATASNYRTRLYRDGDQRLLGGVCSGIAARLNMSVWLIRLLFIGFTFFYGITFLIYIVLWLAVPKARTPLQKMELHQEPITFMNLEDRIRQEYQRMKENQQGERHGIVNVFSSLAMLIGTLGLAILKYSIYIVGFLLIFGGITLAFTFIYGLAIDWPSAWYLNSYYNSPTFFNTVRVIDSGIFPTLLFVFLLLLLPLLMILLGLFCIVRKSALIKFALAGLAIWIVVVIGLGLYFAFSFVNTSEIYSREAELPLNLHVQDTLVIAPIEGQTKRLVYKNAMPLNLFRRDRNIEELQKLTAVELRVKPSDTEYGYISIEKSAQGRDELVCEVLLDELRYAPKIAAKRVEMPAFYELEKTHKEAGAWLHVKATIHVPRGCYVKVDKDLPWQYIGWEDYGTSKTKRLARKIWYNSGTEFVVRENEPFDSLIEDFDIKIEMWNVDSVKLKEE